MKYPYLVIALILLAAIARAQKPNSANDALLAPDAPADRPVQVLGSPTNPSAALTAFQKHIAPAVKQGQATLPQAKRRFLQGLPEGHIFFVTTYLTDPNGNFEQVFIRVKD